MRFASDTRAIRSPDVMSCDEIRYWLKWLRDQGWGREALARAIGLYDGATLRGKIVGSSFIYVTEQRRLSRLIPRILSGELVQDGHQAVLADRPVPLKLPPQLKLDFKTGRLLWQIPRVQFIPTMPGWQAGIANTTEAWR